MTDFSSHFSFAKAALREGCDCLHGELFGGDGVCVRNLDRQISQFMVLLLTLGAMLAVAGARTIIRL